MNGSPPRDRNRDPLCGVADQTDESKAHDNLNTDRRDDCEELLYLIEKRAGLTDDPSNVRTTVHSVLLAGPAPAERLRRPWTSPVDLCDINGAFAGGR